MVQDRPMKLRAVSIYVCTEDGFFCGGQGRS